MPHKAQILHFSVRYLIDRVLSFSHIIASDPNMLSAMDKRLCILWVGTMFDEL